MTYQHDNNVCVRVVAQFPQPALHVLVSQVLGDVVDQKSANCATIVPNNSSEGLCFFLYGILELLSGDNGIK